MPNRSCYGLISERKSKRHSTRRSSKLLRNSQFKILSLVVVLKHITYGAKLDETLDIVELGAEWVLTDILRQMYPDVHVLGLDHLRVTLNGLTNAGYLNLT
jgi:hypothetical protein